MTVHYSAWIAMVRTVDDCVRYSCRKKKRRQQPSFSCNDENDHDQNEKKAICCLSSQYVCILQNRSELCSSHRNRRKPRLTGSEVVRRGRVSNMPTRGQKKKIVAS